MILTVGDSFTSGEELTNPKQDAWPYILANKYESNIINCAEPGASNDFIFTTAIERSTWERFDLVIIQWSDPCRIDLSINGEIHGANPKSRIVSDRAWLDKYYRSFYDDKWAHRKTISKIIALQQHFRSRSQDFIMTSMTPILGTTTTFYSVKGIIDPDTFTDPLVEITFGYPKGPGGHPLEQGHQAIANTMEKHINENINLRITR
jgi:hypothetical protein